MNTIDSIVNEVNKNKEILISFTNKEIETFLINTISSILNKDLSNMSYNVYTSYINYELELFKIVTISNEYDSILIEMTNYNIRIAKQNNHTIFEDDFYINLYKELHNYIKPI